MLSQADIYAKFIRQKDAQILEDDEEEKDGKNGTDSERKVGRRGRNHKVEELKEEENFMTTRLTE